MDPVPARPVEEGVVGLSRGLALQVLLVAVGLSAAAEDQVELARGAPALQHDLLLPLSRQPGCEPGGAGRDRRRLGRGLRQFREAVCQLRR
eukprot:4174965-Alexandrium_andersonii.AAC.1